MAGIVDTASLSVSKLALVSFASLLFVIFEGDVRTCEADDKCPRPCEVRKLIVTLLDTDSGIEGSSTGRSGVQGDKSSCAGTSCCEVEGGC